MMARVTGCNSCFPLLLVVLLGGCGGDEHGDLRAWMDENTRNMHGKVEPLPQVRPYVPYGNGRYFGARQGYVCVDKNARGQHVSREAG